MIKTRTLNFVLGKSFAAPMVFAGYIIFAVGVLALLFLQAAGILVTAMGAFLAFSTNGVLMDKENNRFKEYASYFGMKFGEWKSLSGFPNVAILTGARGFTALSLGNVRMTDTEKSFDVYLLNDGHLKRICVGNFETIEEAQSHCDLVANQFALNKVVYSPKTSIHGRRRR